MARPVWVFLQLVLAVHQMLLSEHGGLQGIRDQGLLETALARPQQKFSFEQNVSIFDLAVAYSYGLARKHPFVDGNKHIALTIAAVLLELNNYSLDAPEGEAVVIYQQLAAGTLTEGTLAK